MRLPTAKPVIEKPEQANLVLVPQLYFSDTANALWKYISHKQLSAEQASEQYQHVCVLPDQTISDQTLVLEALSLAYMATGSCFKNNLNYLPRNPREDTEKSITRK